MKINNVLLTALFAIALPMGAVEAADGPTLKGKPEDPANGKDVYAVDQKVEKNKSDIETLTKEVSDAKTKFDTLSPQVKENEKRVKENAEKIGKLDDRVKKAEESVASAEKSTKENSAKVKANQGIIDDHSKKIAQHDKDIEGLKKQRETSEADLAAATARIKEINDEKNRGLASQAALSGLFQPYTVGRMNVSAAFGGYKSEQGIAVGTGFRYSENFAVKGGVATNLKHASGVAYNVGANFEF